MCEILFRGKRKDNGDWVYGYYEKYNGGSYINLQTDRLNSGGYPIREFIEVIPETVGRFIGLTDKNGKRIFEQDIVKADDYIFVVKYGKCGGVANAENYGYMGFYLEALSESTKLSAKYGLRDDICYFTDIEVIGNMQDSPDFWGGGAEQCLSKH